MSLDLGPFRAALGGAPALQLRGRVVRLDGSGVEAAVGGVALGEAVDVVAPGRAPVAAEVVAVRDGRAVLAPLGDLAGVGADSEVIPRGAPLSIRAGDGLRGRILDGLGRPIDGAPLPPGLEEWPVDRPAPDPLARRRVTAPLPLGVRALDALLTAGEGQRLGLFAGSGVGKSMLLAQIARGTRADVTVVGLVGERGREVRDFVEDALGRDGLSRSVVIAATSDAPPLVRLKAAHVATAVAEWFAERGRRVLFLLDSITRYARACREVALAAGEPPARHGYPASVFAALPRLLERTGSRGGGTITALYTVLVAGGDMEEPIADEVRGILDGHVVLDRRIAAAGRFPAVDVLQSVSRLMPAVAAVGHRAAAARLRALLAAHERVRDLVALGAYRPGADADADAALERAAATEAFLRQGVDEAAPYEDSVARLEALVA